MMRYKEAVEYILEIPKFTAKNSMEDTKAFLKRLGSPEKKLKILHVAGTNGKGSVCAYITSILNAEGRSVGLFTSPHLMDIRERIRIDDEQISEEEFLSLFSRVYEKIERDDEGSPLYHPTFFEFLFFMAMLYFEDKAPDYVVLETGLGGRLDATNAVENKLVSVITPIGLDHTEYLGDTIEKIAAEKAGIMRRGTPAVYAADNEAAKEVIEKRGKELEAPLYPVEPSSYKLSKFNNNSIDFLLDSIYYGNIKCTISTCALYQLQNAAVAVKTVECAVGRAAKDSIIGGLLSMRWRGRMEEVLPGVFIDGAHNIHGIRAFLESVSMDGFEGKRTLLFGAVSDKDIEAEAELIASSGLFTRIVLTAFSDKRSADRERLTRDFSGQGVLSVIYNEDCLEAFRTLISGKAPDERIYAAGSLYLAGELLGIGEKL
ncbi:MAG: bifunctional folylpolyglutamate synthase/dihydrofolate synthase [Lachnospiraceae bacterium]|nr:bifunctional folylpolyglutamate synthase/dihydrofolate synthase [Lachnospiraceae bacterium]